MESKRHKLLLIFVLLCMIMLLGFKDTGIVVKEYMSIKEDGSQVHFNKGDIVEVIREGEDTFIIVKDDVGLQIPKDKLIRTTNRSHKYKVIENTPILDKPEGKILRTLNSNELVTPEKIDGEYGMFITSDNIRGFVKLEALQPYASESLTQGISLVNKVIKIENKYYVLAKGETVTIKDYKDSKFIVIDAVGNEFPIDDKYIELRRIREQVTRSSSSRKTEILNKIIVSAYSKLGKPYVYSDTGRRGYDCSGLTYSIFNNELGIKINRTSSGQSKDGIFVSRVDLIPGDLVFFNTTGRGISHVGIYIGDGNMIHASSGSVRKVVISTIESGYYSQRYVTARRIIK